MSSQTDCVPHHKEVFAFFHFNDKSFFFSVTVLSNRRCPKYLVSYSTANFRPYNADIPPIYISSSTRIFFSYHDTLFRMGGSINIQTSVMLGRACTVCQLGMHFSKTHFLINRFSNNLINCRLIVLTCVFAVLCANV